MADLLHLFAVVLVASAVTWAARAAPFALLAPLRDSSLLPYLAARMPVGVMVILTVYTLRHVHLHDAGVVVPTVSGIAVTAGLHLWRGHMILSLAGGTGVYVVLASTLFS